MSIRYKLLLFLILLALFTHTIITSVYYLNSQTLVKELATYHLTSLASIQQQRISEPINNNFDKLNLVSSRTQLRRSLKLYQDTEKPEHLALIQKIISDAVNESRFIENIIILDMNGQLITSTSNLEYQTKYTNHKLFIEGKKQPTASILNSSIKGDKTSFVFSAPLILNGERLGVVAMQSNMKQINESFRDYSGLGQTGEMLLATKTQDNNTLFFTPHRFTSFPQLYSNSHELSKLVNNEQNTGSELLYMKDYRNKNVFVKTRFFPELELTILVKMDESEVLSFNDELKQLIIYLIFFLIIVILIASLISAHKLTRPVIDITEVAVMISKGDFEKRISDYSNDELGQLAKALDNMADILIDSNNTLEKRVRDKTAELQDANRKLEKIAQTDALTGLKNRGYFDENVEIEWRRSLRHNLEVSILLLDIDHFKSINDNKGHQIGDQYLQSIAQLFKSRIKRAGDLVARYGGEEFIILLSETNLTNALTIADELRESVEGLRLPNEHSSTSQYVTISIGVCSTLPNHDNSVTECIKCADDLLYEAKNTGRNRVLGHQI